MYIKYFIFVDPAGGIKGRTWGPSSVQKERHQRSSVIVADLRWTKSAPNLERSLRSIGGHSNIGALQELCKILTRTKINNNTTTTAKL